MIRLIFRLLLEICDALSRKNYVKTKVASVKVLIYSFIIILVIILAIIVIMFYLYIIKERAT